MNIYQIDKEMMELIDPETGELKDEEAFEGLQMERDRKIENVALWWKNEQADIAALKAEIDALTARKEGHNKTAERLAKYLGDALKGGTYETSKVLVKFRASTQVEILDATIIPGEYTKVTTTVTTAPDKVAIKAAINEGKEIPGAQIIEKQNIKIT